LFHEDRRSSVTDNANVVRVIIEQRSSCLKAWPVLGICIIEIILLLAHWFLFHTWMSFWGHPSHTEVLAMRVALMALAFSFIAAALLSFRFHSTLVVYLYKIAVLWLGFLNYFFWAACLCWLAWYASLAMGLGANPASARPMIWYVLFAAALVTGIYGLVNARATRLRRIEVVLPGLPQSWRGRKAVIMSDLHLGNVNGVGFARRIVSMASELKPDIVFIPGDVFDGTWADLDVLIAPFKELPAPFGIYFSTGNHEEFSSPEHYVAAVERAGMRNLHNEMVTVDGLHIAGVPFGDSTSPIRLKAVLDGMRLNPAEPNILLNHMPSRLPIVEHAGVSLQLSGHTHGGQLAPFSWMTRRIFGRFTHGLHRFGELQVYTSTGAGTWGPPMRVGTEPEIVLLTFS
jgi:predicted MPP superfamily phosphohydrolase